MIKEIKTEKFEGLAVLMPDRYVSAFANMGYLVVKTENPATDISEDDMFPPDRLERALERVSRIPEHISLPAIKLPDGEFKILGKATELTEEQCAEIVDIDNSTEYYKAYCDENAGFIWGTAKDSFTSLIQSMECYSVNPFGNLRLCDEDAGSELETETYPKWKIAQANTGTWLILKRI